MAIYRGALTRIDQCEASITVTWSISTNQSSVFAHLGSCADWLPLSLHLCPGRPARRGSSYMKHPDLWKHCILWIFLPLGSLLCQHPPIGIAPSDVICLLVHKGSLISLHSKVVIVGNSDTALEIENNVTIQKWEFWHEYTLFFNQQPIQILFLIVCKLTNYCS